MFLIQNVTRPVSRRASEETEPPAYSDLYSRDDSLMDRIVVSLDLDYDDDRYYGDDDNNDDDQDGNDEDDDDHGGCDYQDDDNDDDEDDDWI